MATEIKINENSIFVNGVEYVKKQEQPTPKDGEVWYVEGKNTEVDDRWLFIARDNGAYLGCYGVYNLVDNTIDFTLPKRAYVMDRKQAKLLRPATPEEIELFYSKLAENGKKWNAEKKCLEDLPKPLKEGDLAIFWDTNKSVAVIAIFGNPIRDWFKNAIPFESIEQYKEFITVHKS